MNITKVIDVDKIEYFTISSNLIRILHANNEVYFFRECSLHYSFEEYMDLSVKLFADIAKQGCSVANFEQKIPIRTTFSDIEISKFLDFMSKWKRKGFIESLPKILRNLKSQKFSIWNNRYTDVTTEVLRKINPGVHINSELIEIVSYFLLFIRGRVYSFNMNPFCKINTPEFFFASKSLATYTMAKLLGVECLVTRSKLVEVRLGGHFNRCRKPYV